MTNFDVSKEWTVLVPPELVHERKAAEDLSRYIGLLAGLCVQGPNKGSVPRPIIIADAAGPAPSGAVIVINSGPNGPEQNGFSWRAEPDRVEIFGESNRGLCNGIYSFLSVLGISWPAPGQEKLPSLGANAPHEIPLVKHSVHEPSNYKGNDPGAVPWRRFVPAGKRVIRDTLKKSEVFAAWAARHRYDALVFPLEAFASGFTGPKLKLLKKIAGEYDIALEAGGRDLSSLVPRKYFSFHKDFFRMEEGRRTKVHHFCPTNPGAIGIINKMGKKLFLGAEGINTFHLWPDRGAEKTWCSCPTCRAFTPVEQNRIAVNAAADVLSTLDSSASITYFENSGEDVNIPMRKTLYRIERLPEEKEFASKNN